MSQFAKNFYRYRFLLGELVRKGIKLKYRKSYFGILWSLFEPLLTMFVLAFVFGKMLGNNNPQFPVFILTGRLIFDLYNKATKEALKSVRSNASMIKKVYVPKYMYPLSAVLTNYVLFAISLVDLVAVCIIYKVSPTWHMFEAIIPLFTLLIFSLGTGMILATLDVFFHDIEYLWNVLLMLIMYCCAIFYLPEKLEAAGAGWVLKWNPLYAVIKNFRFTIIDGRSIGINSSLYALGCAFLSLLIGLWCFYKKQDEFILHV